MVTTPLTVVAFVLVLLLFVAAGVWFLRRIDDSPSDRLVARSRAQVSAARADVAASAVGREWVVTAAPTDEAFPSDLVPRRAEARACEFLVVGARPRPFSAATWQMAHRNAGAIVTSGLRQHRLTVDLSVELSRFAVSGVHNWRLMLASIPDSLVAHPRVQSGLDVYGDDHGAAAALASLAADITEAQVWLVVDRSRLVVVRAGELDAAALTTRLDLADRVAEALCQK